MSVIEVGVAVCIMSSGSGLFENAPPVPRGVSECIAFEAVIQSEEGELDESTLLEHGLALTGAVHGERWYLSAARGSDPPERMCCDGVRIWTLNRAAVLIAHANRQMLVPLESCFLPQLLQTGERLWGSFDAARGRFDYPSFGIEALISEKAVNGCTVEYVWTNGAMRSNYRYGFRLVDGAWFWHCGDHSTTRVAGDGSEVPCTRMQLSMEEPFSVGNAVVARRLRSQGWSPNPRKPTEAMDLGRTTLGLLQKADLLPPAAFDAELARWTTLETGTRVIDMSRPAVFSFVIGDRVIDFEGVGYVLATAVTAPPSDREFVNMLRTSKRDAARDQAESRVTGSNPASGGGQQGPTRSAPTRSVGLLIAPGRRVDLGMVMFGETPSKATATFTLRNTSMVTRAIKAVKASCGCTETSVDQKVLEPGATATITTTLTVERSKTYHSSIWVTFEDAAGGVAQIEELQVIAVGVPEKAIRATVLKADPAGDVLTIVLYSDEGKPEGDVGVPKEAESTIASDSGWLPLGGDAKIAKHWIRDIVKKP